MVVLDVMCECASRKCDWENVGLCLVRGAVFCVHPTVQCVQCTCVCESCAQAQVVGLCAVFGVVCIVQCLAIGVLCSVQCLVQCALCSIVGELRAGGGESGHCHRRHLAPIPSTPPLDHLLL